jgi:hypothetical protein
MRSSKGKSKKYPKHGSGISVKISPSNLLIREYTVRSSKRVPVSSSSSAPTLVYRSHSTHCAAAAPPPLALALAVRSARPPCPPPPFITRRGERGGAQGRASPPHPTPSKIRAEEGLDRSDSGEVPTRRTPRIAAVPFPFPLHLLAARGSSELVPSFHRLASGLALHFFPLESAID